MRLVDADKNDLPIMQRENGEWVFRCTLKEMLDFLPTVDAIPVEWIKKYIEDNTKVVKNPKYDGWYFSEEPIDYYIKFRPYDIEFMLNKWEKENETCRCR